MLIIAAFTNERITGLLLTFLCGTSTGTILFVIDPIIITILKKLARIRAQDFVPQIIDVALLLVCITFFACGRTTNASRIVPIISHRQSTGIAGFARIGDDSSLLFNIIIFAHHHLVVIAMLDKCIGITCGTLGVILIGRHFLQIKYITA